MFLVPWLQTGGLQFDLDGLGDSLSNLWDADLVDYFSKEATDH